MAREDVGPALLEAIRRENLGVYRESPIRVREDASQEAEITTNYRGRLVYELLQNADDAMYADPTHDDRIYFRLDANNLWVGNSGRPLTEADIRGLCGTGASSKGEHTGPKRAFIGQKGMGFKSVLEITDRPRVYSTSAGFQMDAELARPAVDAQLREKGQAPPQSVPVMRFPWPLTDEPPEWTAARRSGINTLFQFPLRSGLSPDQWDSLADRLFHLPVSTVLFLKHLEQVEVTVNGRGATHRRIWRVTRERRGDGWEAAPGFVDSGVYRVQVSSDGQIAGQFLVAHDADVEIGEHRSGLSGDTWEGIEVSEVSVAAPWPPSAEASWAHAFKFHVFLPTEEPSPYPLLVNGAFAADLSRQKIAATSESTDYNGYLARQAARVLVTELFPELEREGASVADLLRLLDRGGPTFIGSAGIAKALYDGVREELRGLHLVPTENGQRIPVDQSVVPPVAMGNGDEYRGLLAPEARAFACVFPVRDLCVSELGRVLVDHGGRELKAPEAAAVLAEADPQRSALRDHPSGGPVKVDPVLSVLGSLWSGLREDERDEFESAVRAHQLFPIAVQGPSVVRVATTDVECFYPPRSFSGDPPLSRLRFLAREVAWGGLTPKDRNILLRDDMPVWQGLFGLREFKFPDVMRASVLPALVIDPDEESLVLRRELASVDRLAAICQLAGRAPKTDATLPYQRLGSDRALFNLARLRVPCRPDGDGVVRWIPAFRVYFGRDWTGDASVESLVDAAVARATSEIPEVPMLAPPSYFLGQLAHYRELADIEADTDSDGEPSSEEVSDDEDDEAALATDEKEQWATFLTWLGVNHVMRPVSFHDVEDRTSGWLSTSGLKKPQGDAFARLGSYWDQYASDVRAHVSTLDHSRTPYFFELHDLEYRNAFAQLAAADDSGTIARAMWQHLARNWARAERFGRLRLAMVPTTKSPGQRSLVKPLGDELVDSIEDFWLWRLKRHNFAPTSQGPRKPRAAWLPSQEIDRRFGRRDWAAGNLVPVLEVPPELARGKGLAFAQAMGVRDALSPSTFGLDDADLLLRRIAHLFGTRAQQGTLTPADLRQTIRPAYRNLFDLLTSQPEGPDTEGALADSPLLVTNGADDYRFASAAETVFADRNGARERIGVTGELWMFVLEGYPTARAPLQRFMGSRLLEDALEWTAEPFDPMEDPADVAKFRAGLKRLAPYILLRMRADRSEMRLAAQDAQRLRAFVGSVQPVGDVRVGCQLDGWEVAKAASRDRHVRLRPDGSVEAYMKWGSDPWPPSRVDAEALAAALTDLFETSLFESFFTLSSSESSESRLRTLRMAGAPTDLLEAELELGPHDEESGANAFEIERVAPTADEEPTDDASGPSQPPSDPRDGRIPLYDPTMLLIEGVPVMVAGGQEKPPAGGGEAASNTESTGGDGWRRGLTDLTELDRVGMAVAMVYEQNRLNQLLEERVGIFDPLAPWDRARVFNVSTPEAVRGAKAGSQPFREVLAYLTDHGLAEDFPGFDILSIDPVQPTRPSRLIELKSSGVNASIQTMTWNEWKTAKDSRLRSYFYLYLVGNLRSDLAGARPFVRAIHDPVRTLLSTESRETVRRAVQVDVRHFTVAEHLDLTVKTGSG